MGYIERVQRYYSTGQSETAKVCPEKRYWIDGVVEELTAAVRQEYEEKFGSGGFDKGGSLTADQKCILGECKGLLGFSPDGKSIIEGSLLHEIISQIPPRLSWLAQWNPILQGLIGVDGFSRYQHSVDAMLLTAEMLLNMAVTAPELFDEWTQDLAIRVDKGEFPGVDPAWARRLMLILHPAYYMALHDSKTLALAGATHNLAALGHYDEDEAFMQALFSGHYSTLAGRIDRDIFQHIAVNAIKGTTMPSLENFIKGSSGRLSVDAIAYIGRGMSELAKLFNLVGDYISPFDVVSNTYSGMQTMSNALRNKNPVSLLPQHERGNVIPFEKLVSPDMVKLVEIHGQIVPAYDEQLVFLLQLGHIFSRMAVSGAPLVRGSEWVIRSKLLEIFTGEDELLQCLSEETDSVILTRYFTDIVPMELIGPEYLAEPANLPRLVTGWGYTGERVQNVGPVAIQLRNFSNELVCTLTGGIMRFQDRFPQTTQRINALRTRLQKNPLYLEHPYLQIRSI